MPSAVFQIAAENRLPKCDRLFRAAITGYCSLTRPTGRDAAQLDDLALPLLPLVTEESKRFAAAALSETLPAPPALLRRLADYPVAVSAPLLARSRALADIDLIGLIGRNGVAHARAIARRPGLNPNIAALVRALGVAPQEETPVAEADAPEIHQPVAEALQEERISAAEDTRERLRAMMRPSAEAQPENALPASLQREPQAIDWSAAHAAFPRMVATGLTGVAALFQTAIADAFDLSFDRACWMVEDEKALPTALRAAGLSVAEAFFVTALAFPPRFSGTAAIRSFVEDYRGLDMEAARARVSAWHAKAPRAVHATAIPEPANSGLQPTEPAAPRLLRAS